MEDNDEKIKRVEGLTSNMGKEKNISIAIIFGIAAFTLVITGNTTLFLILLALILVLLIYLK